MSVASVIRHLQKVLNNCGDPVVLRPTGNVMMGENGQIVAEVVMAYVLIKNECCELSPPFPMCHSNQDGKYCINRVRFSASLVDDYSKNFPLTDEQMRNIVCTKQGLFGCFEQ